MSHVLIFYFKKIGPENGKMVEGRGLTPCSQCLRLCFNTGSSHIFDKGSGKQYAWYNVIGDYVLEISMGMWAVSKVESPALILLVSFSDTLLVISISDFFCSPEGFKLIPKSISKFQKIWKIWTWKIIVLKPWFFISLPPVSKTIDNKIQNKNWF